MMLKHLLLAAVLAAALTCPAWATAVDYSVSTAGGYTSYLYYLTSDELGDLVTSFHVYAPTDAASILAISAEPGWLSSVDPDPEGGVDIWWYPDTSITEGLASGDRLDVAIATSAAIPTTRDYRLPGFLGNWGYETRDWAMFGVLIMDESIPVPQGAAVTPEPVGFMVLVAGCLALAPWRRRKQRH